MSSIKLFSLFLNFNRLFMKNIILSLFVYLSATVYSQNTEVIAGQQFFKSISIGGENLILNGGGLREKYWFDLIRSGAIFEKTKTQMDRRLFTKMMKWLSTSN
jgi:hypothetical protein